MLRSTFEHLFKQSGGVRLDDHHILFRKPVELFNISTGESISFKSLDEALEHDFNGETIREYIKKASPDLFSIKLQGGRGGSSGMGNQTFKFGHASGGNGPDRNESDFPSRVNVNIKNPDETLKAFRKLHLDENREHAFTVDPQGFVTSYVHGNATNVSVIPRRGEMVYHNHPSGGAFSDSDLISTAVSPGRGIVASGKNGDYIFQKSNGFKANSFVKAVRNAKMTGKSYDDAVDKWLTANQRKYGYKYEFRKAK